MKRLLIMSLLFSSLSCFASESFKIDGSAGSVVGILDLGKVNKTINEACLMSSERAEKLAANQCEAAGGIKSTTIEKKLSVRDGQMGQPTACTVTVSILCNI